MSGTRTATASLATRASLLKRIRNWGDEQSWQEFFNTYWRMIYALAVRSGLSESEAEEVVQTTVLGVANRIREFKYDPKIGSFRNWLLTQARWRVADQLRKRNQERRLIAPRSPTRSDALTRTRTIERVPDPEGTFEQVSANEWKKAVCETALQTLRNKVNPKQYQVFDLYTFKHWPVGRIRRTLGVSVPQVYLICSRLKRQWNKERARVERQFEREPLVKLSHQMCDL